jgi:hypothetical protein
MQETNPALENAYKLAKSKGYKKDITEFTTLISSNEDALNNIYKSVQSKGYKKSIDDFKQLIGISDVKKKENSSSSTTNEKSVSKPQNGSSDGKGYDEISEKYNFTNTKTPEIKESKLEKQGVKHINQEDIIAQKEQPLKTQIKKDNIELGIGVKTEEQLAEEKTKKEALINSFNENTIVSDDFISDISTDFDEKLNQTGVWNGIKTGLKSTWNKVMPYLPGSPNDKDVRKNLEFELDPLADVKKEAKKNLLDSGLKEEDITEQKINEIAKKIYVNKELSDKRISLSNDYLEGISDDDRKILKADKNLQLESISLQDKKLLNTITLIDNNLEKDYSELSDLIEISKNGGLSQEEIKRVTQLQDVLENNLKNRQEIYSKYSNNSKELGTVQEEYDILKRNYGSLENFGLKIGLGVAKITTGLAQSYNMVLGDDKDKKEVADIQKAIDEVLQEEIQKETQEVRSFNDVVDYVSDLVGNQAPNLGLMYLTGGGSSMVKPLSSIAAYSVGNKYSELENENNYGEGNYTKSEMYVASLVSGGAEAIEMNTLRMLGGGKRLVQSTLSSTPTRELFRKSIGKKLQSASSETFKNVKGEILEEELTNVVQNFSDRYILGDKSVGILDNSIKVAKDAASMSILMTSFPAAASAVIKPFVPKSYVEVLDKNTKRIAEIQEILNNPNLSEETRKEGNKLLKESIDNNKRGLKEIILNTSKLDDSFVEKVIELETKSSEIRNKANAISNDKSISKSQKEFLLKELQTEYNSSENLREKINSGKATKLDLLDEKEVLKLKDKAGKQLIKEAEESGKKEASFNDEQITKRALEIYNETKPKKEINEPIVVNKTTTDTKEQATKVKPAPSISLDESLSENNNPNQITNDLSNKSIEELEKRKFELDEKGFRSLTKESDEYNKIDKELEKKEWQSVLGSPLSEVEKVIDDLIEKDKEMPNGYGSYIEKRDARESKEIVAKYKGEVSKKESIKDFKDAFFGNPDTWYADALKMRESVRSFIEKGGTFKELLKSVQKEFESDGFSEQDAAGVINSKLSKIAKTNESTQTEDIVTDGNIQPRVEPMGELAESKPTTTNAIEEESVSNTNEPKPSEGKPKVTTKEVVVPGFANRESTYDVDMDYDGNITEIRSKKDGRVINEFVEYTSTKIDKKTKLKVTKKGIRKNANYAKIESAALGIKTENQQNINNKEFISNFEPTNEYDAALKSLASGDKVSPKSLQSELGNSDSSWATNKSSKETLPSVEALAEQIWESNPNFDVQEVRNALIDIIGSHANLNSVKESLLDAHKENVKRIEEQEISTYLGSLSEQELAMYETVKAEDDYISELTDDEAQRYYEQEYRKNTGNYENEQGTTKNDEIGITKSESVQESNGREKSEPRAVEEKVVEQSIDKVFSKETVESLEKANKPDVLDFLDSLKLDPNDLNATLPFLPQTWNLFIDAIKLAYKGGKTIAEAIEIAKQKLIDKGISNKEINAVIEFFNKKAQKTNTSDFKRKPGQRSLLQRLRNGGNEDIVNRVIDRIGLTYEKNNQEKTYADAVNFVEEVGIAEAYNAIKEGKIKNPAAVTVIYAELIERLPREIENALSTITDNDALLEATKEFDAYFEDIINEYATRATEFGQANSILNYIYNKAQTVRYSLSKQVEIHKSINGGKVDPETMEKLKELEAKYKEAVENIKQLEEKNEAIIAQQAFERIIEEQKRKLNIGNKRPNSAQAKKVAESVRKLKINRPGVFKSSTGADLVWDGAVEIVAKSIETTGRVADAINEGIDFIKKSNWYKGLNNQEKQLAEQQFVESFEGISDSNSLNNEIAIDKNGDIKVSGKVLTDFVKDGGTDVNNLVDIIKKEIESDYPHVSKREIRDAITGYGKRANKNKSQLREDISRLKNLGKLESELEDVQKGIAKNKGSKASKRKLSDKENLLKKQIKGLQDKLGITEKERTERSKEYTKKRIEEIKNKIKNGDFSKKEIKPITEDAELKKLRTEKNRIEEDFEKLKHIKELEQRSIGERIKDHFSDLWDSQRVTRATGELSFVGAQGGFYVVDGFFSRKTFKNLAKNIKGTTANDWKPRNIFGTISKITKSAQSVNAIAEMFDKMATKNNYDDFEAILKDHPYYDVFLKSKLRILGEDAKTQVKDEMFIGNAVLSILKLPAAGLTYLDKGKKRTTIHGYFEKLRTGKVSDKNKKSIIEMTGPLTVTGALERGNNTFMNIARIDLFMRGAKMLELQGKNPIDHIDEYKKLASAVNTITGSANLSQTLTMAVPILNKLIFSTRYWASSLNMTPPVSLYYLWKLGNYDSVLLGKPSTWKGALEVSVAQKTFLRTTIKGMTAMFGAASYMLYLANSVKDDDEEKAYIEYDPRSSDFMQVVDGKKRTDFFGPYRNNIVLFSKIYTRESKKNGEIKSNGEGVFSRTNKDIFFDYISNKANPFPGMFLRNMAGKKKMIINEETGIEEEKVMLFEDDVAIETQMVNNLYPIFVDTTNEIIEEDPELGEELYIMLAFIGKQTSVY